MLQMESIIRHCFVLNPKEYAKAHDEGDDIFMCEYEYDIQWHSFKRLADIDNGDEVRKVQLSVYFSIKMEPTHSQKNKKGSHHPVAINLLLLFVGRKVKILTLMKIGNLPRMLSLIQMKM